MKSLEGWGTCLCCWLSFQLSLIAASFLDHFYCKFSFLDLLCGNPKFLIWTFVGAVQLLSYVVLFVTRGLRHDKLPCPSPSPGVCPDSCPLSQWCHPTISSSVVPFSSYLQSFPASRSFPISWLFTSSGQSIGVTISVLPMNIQGLFPLHLYPKKVYTYFCWESEVTAKVTLSHLEGLQLIWESWIHPFFLDTHPRLIFHSWN